VLRRFPIPTAVLLTLCLPPAAAAQTNPADAQSIRIGATIFYDYTHTRQPQEVDDDGNVFSPSGFDVKRTYINVRGNINRRLSFRITPDIKRESGSGSSLKGSLSFRLKYAYVQLDLSDWMPSGSQLLMGIVQTPFIDAQDSVYRYRFQGTQFVERDGGESSADAGIAFSMPLANDYGDIKIGLYNGEGYSKPEANNRKSIQIFGRVRPMPRAEGALRGLRLAAFYNADQYQADAPRRLFVAAAMFEHARLNAGFDFLTGTDQRSARALEVSDRGFSFFVTPFLQEKGNGWEGLLRFDQYDADTDVAGVQRRLIVGAAYWFPHPGGSATAALLFDYEQVSFSDFATAREKQQRFAVHGLINF